MTEKNTNYLAKSGESNLDSVLQKQLQNLMKGNTVQPMPYYVPLPTYPSPCPSCGHCPTCGRQTAPAPYYQGPMWISRESAIC